MRSSLLVAALTLLVALPPATLAGIADTPLPPGTIHLFSVPGVINANLNATYSFSAVRRGAL